MVQYINQIQIWIRKQRVPDEFVRLVVDKDPLHPAPSEVAHSAHQPNLVPCTTPWRGIHPLWKLGQKLQGFTKNPQTKYSMIWLSQTRNIWYIYLQVWSTFMVNVCKCRYTYTIHWASGYWGYLHVEFLRRIISYWRTLCINGSPWAYTFIYCL